MDIGTFLRFFWDLLGYFKQTRTGQHPEIWIEIVEVFKKGWHLEETKVLNKNYQYLPNSAMSNEVCEQDCGLVLLLIY